MDQPVAEDYTKRTERIKHLLSSYYGLDDSGQSTPVSPGSARGDADSIGSVSRMPQISSLDSPGFNADKHIQQVLKASTLEKLIKEHHNMSRDIKNLDTDMQQLVYENYNKFITATDTIRAMKANVDGMGMEMDKLKGIIDTVTENSNSVNSKLQQRRDHLDNLSSVQSITRKLQLLYDLPARMQAALSEDALETAVTMYAEASPLLKKYGYCGAFKAVAQQADATAKEITQILKKRLNERNHDAGHVVLLLRRLGEPDEGLQDKYLQGRTQRLKRIMKEASVVVDVMAAAYSGKPVTEAMLKKVENPGSWGFTEDLTPPALNSFITAMDERVINNMQETVLNLSNMFQQEDSSQVTRKALVNMAKDVFNEYFKILKRAFADTSAAAIYKAARMKEASELTDLADNSQSLVFMTDWGSDMLAQALQHMSADVCLLSSHLPELSLKDRCSEVAERAVRHHISNGFTALEERVSAAVALAKVKMQEESAGQKPSGLLVTAFAYTSKALQGGLYALLMGLKAFETHHRLLSGWHDIFVDLVQAHLQHMFLSVLAAFMEVTQVKYDGIDLLAQALQNSAHLSEGFARTSDTLSLPRSLSLDAQAAALFQNAAGHTSSTPEPPKSAMVLLLAKLCLYMEHAIVPFTMEFLANNFAGRGGGRGGDQPPSFVAGEVARKLHTASSTLLQAYVELHGRQLSLMVRRSVAATNWLHHKEPRAARPVCDLMCDCLNKARAEVVQLVDSTSSNNNGSTGNKGNAQQAPTRHGHSRTVSEGTLGSLGLESGNVQRNVAKIFREKVQIFGNVQLTQPATMAAIVGVGIKSLVECIRLQTLGRAGLQQLQLDMHYLRPLLLNFTSGSYVNTLESLMAEVISSSVERSTDPQLLDPAVLDRILATANQLPGNLPTTGNSNMRV